MADMSRVENHYCRVSYVDYRRIQPGEGTYEDTARQLSAYITKLRTRGDKATPAEREELERVQELKANFNKFHDKQSRIIGHVLFSPKYSLGKSETGADRLRDWALIELHQEKHETVSEMRNRVVTAPPRRPATVASYLS
ncbi:hypothetical protein HZ326_20033 [Fusarium oxysporum f. sp. albedinis]|nr:hypothetical protein HZ326_20033 [Fusarium oxysporum f. sp. albedinis]